MSWGTIDNQRCEDSGRRPQKDFQRRREEGVEKDRRVGGIWCGSERGEPRKTVLGRGL